MRKGLFFDCDGVLADTKQANYFSYISALEKTFGVSFGERFPFESYEQVYGKSWIEWLPSIAANMAPEVHDLKIQIYAEHLQKYAKPLAGLRAVDYWRNRGHEIAIVSNSSAHSIAQLLKWIKTGLGIRYLQEIPVFTPSETIPAKPHPAMIREAFAALRVNSGILIDDDLEIGTLTAQNAEIAFVHYVEKLDELNSQIEVLLI
jgi:beta-phosphoglucomutase-like phosphatase (HAD superfamily)